LLRRGHFEGPHTEVMEQVSRPLPQQIAVGGVLAVAIDVVLLMASSAAPIA
jgi:hypothetical protein